MLGKLMKHELRSTAKIYLPLMTAVVAMLGGFQLIFLVVRMLLKDAPNPLVSILFGLFSVLSAFALLAMLVLLVLVPVQRFYKNLLGDEGYLMFTLPATPAQQICSKLFSGVIWAAAGVVVCVLAVLLFCWNLPDVMDLSSVAASFQSETGLSFYLVLLLFSVFLLFAFVNTWLHFYLCMAIGGQWPQNRLLASAAAYLILNAALQILLFVGLIAAALVFYTLDSGSFRGLQTLAQQSPMGFFFGILGVNADLMAVLDLVYFFATRWLLGKRLNLA